MSKNKNDFVNVNNASKKDQIEVMKKIANQAHCPFCEKNLRLYHKKPILEVGKYWLLTTNQWPYKHTKYHFLFIYKKHATKLEELESKAGSELFEIIQSLEKKYAFEGGGFSMRFGDTDFSAGTINHLHVQLIIPDAMAKNFKPVKIKLGLDWERRK